MNLNLILSQIGSFLNALAGNGVTLGIIAIMIAGTIGRLAFKTIKRFIH